MEKKFIIFLLSQGFSLEFYFSENEHFTNRVLAKSYVMSCSLPDDDPFSFEGASITSVKGCVCVRAHTPLSHIYHMTILKYSRQVQD